jgi:histidinol phosphatase-like enzyme (inositol monophosphatase family)
MSHENATADDAPQGEQVSLRLTLALEAAKTAGAKTLRYYDRFYSDTRVKPDEMLVDAAKSDAERELRAAIEQSFPEDEILSEWAGVRHGDSGYRWIIEPINGIETYVMRVPLYGTLVAVEREQRSLIGVIHLPALGETVYAQRGGGAWYTTRGQVPQAACVSNVRSLGEARVCTCSSRHVKRAERADVFASMCHAAGIMQELGDCYAYLLVATGRVDAVVEPAQDARYTVPVSVIVTEAGGRFTDLAGGETRHTGTGVATNGRIHDELLAIVGTG